MKVIYSSNFLRTYRQLPGNVKSRAEDKEIIFRKNPFDQRLKTHKLTGSFADFWAFSVDYRHRIIFEFRGKNMAIFHKIGDHSIYL